MPMKARVISVLAAAVLAAAGCGDSDEREGTTAARTVTEPAPLSAAEVAILDRTRAEVDSYCVHVGDRVSEGREPEAARFDRVVNEVERLESLADYKPLAPAPDGSTPRFALGDIAEDLEGSNCDSRLARRIDEALAALPGE